MTTDQIKAEVTYKCKVELIYVLDLYTEEYIKWIFMRFTGFISDGGEIDYFLNLYKMCDVSNVHRESIIYFLDMDNNYGCISEQSFLRFLRDCQKIDPPEYIKYKPSMSNMPQPSFIFYNPPTPSNFGMPQPPSNFGMPQPPSNFGMPQPPSNFGML